MAHRPVIIKLLPERREYIRSENDFLRTLGECVTAWAFVDRELFRLFCLGLQTSTRRAAAIYYKQRTLQVRLQFVNDLMQQHLGADEFRDAWKPLEKEISDLLPVRNIIVHHPAKRTGTSRRGRAVYDYSIHIEPYERLLNKKYDGLRGKKEVTVGDLKEHAVNVSVLREGLRQLVNLLGSRSERPS